MDITSKLPGCAGQAADALSAYTQILNARCTIVVDHSKVRMSRYLDSSTKTQMASLMVQYGRSGRSFLAKSARSSFGRTITISPKMITNRTFLNFKHARGKRQDQQRKKEIDFCFECQSEWNSNKCRSSCPFAVGASVLNFHFDRNSNKRGCGSLVKAQASARVDVPTAPFFLQCGPRSPTRVQVFVRMLGYVFVRQPTVIMRE